MVPISRPPSMATRIVNRRLPCGGFSLVTKYLSATSPVSTTELKKRIVSGSNQ